MNYQKKNINYETQESSRRGLYPYNQFYNLPIRDRDYLLMYFSSLDILIWFIMIHIDIPNRLKRYDQFIIENPDLDFAYGLDLIRVYFPDIEIILE